VVLCPEFIRDYKFLNAPMYRYKYYLVSMSSAQVYLPWFWFHKCPPMIIPNEYKSNWWGYYVPSAPNEEFPDLETPSGNFTICDDFDFANPKTDYDRACAPFYKTAILKVREKGWALIIDTPYVIAYWDAKQTFIVKKWAFDELQVKEHNSTILDTLENNWDTLQWQDQEELEVQGSELCLMNSCEHGADPAISKEELLYFQLESGKYQLQHANFASLDLELFHFEKISPKF